MVTFNGYVGCTWCLMRGEHKEGYLRYTTGFPAEARTSSRVKEEMELATILKDTVNGLKGPTALMNLKGMMGCRVVLLIEAGSPRLSLSDGHTSMESAPPGCSSLLVPCEDAGLLRGGWLLGTVNEVCFTSTLGWLTPTLVEAFRPP
ncbi:hypothetical protein MTO96_003082 [Rhipicephalus appendiculatus]